MKTLRPRQGVLARHIGSLPMFSGLSEADRETLADQASLRSYDRGEALFEMGDATLCLFGVVEGSVRLVRPDPGGREKVLHLAAAPNTVAELPVMMKRPFPATALCNDACTVVVVARAGLLDLAEHDNDFLMRLLGTAMARLQHLTAALARHGHKSAVVRVAAYLRGMSEGCACIELPAAKKDVANYLGLQPESFSRALASLREAGAIEVEEHLVRIVDRGALERCIQDE